MNQAAERAPVPASAALFAALRFQFRMRGVEAGLECLVIEPRFLQLGFEIVEAGGVRLRTLILA